MKGVIGLYTKENVSLKSLYTLYGVQHRGQESSGIAASGDRSLRVWNGKGLVSKVFDERFNSFIHPEDYVVIGATSGEGANNGIPPYVIESERYIIAFAFDGYIHTSKERSYEDVFAEGLRKNLGEDVIEAFAETVKEFKNAYFSLVASVLDKARGKSFLLAARDRRGVRPLHIALDNHSVVIASESAPVDVLEGMGEIFKERRDVSPGTLVTMSETGFTEIKIEDPKPATCVFEWVYFARPDSVIDGVSVHLARKRLGHALVTTRNLRKKLGTENGPRSDLAVIPVPDSGRSVCTGVAEALGHPADEGIIKNAYLGRTYIIDDPKFRKTASDLKHNVIRATVKGKEVAICDDSIVRGTVSESVAKSLRKAGATHVDFLVSYAPIFYPCFSDPSDKPLAAQPFEGKSVGEIGELVAEGLPSIDEVLYNTPQNVLDAVGLPNRVCIYCSTGCNPFKEL
jgi:amidophosphoribosyltransferase